jgi:hypothetical protein
MFLVLKLGNYVKVVSYNPATCNLLQIHEQQRGQEFYLKQSDLFDNKVYVEEICDVICIALAELPAVLSIQDVVETLLHVKHGPEIVCWVVANSPDCFREGETYNIIYLLLFSWSYLVSTFFISMNTRTEFFIVCYQNA